MADVSSLPDWDALDEHQRQTHKGEVRVGRWIYAFHIHHDTDRLFLDLLTDAPLATWASFVAPSDPQNFQSHLTSLFDALGKKPCLDLDHIDWAALQQKLEKTASLIASRRAMLPKVNDPFALYASAYHNAAVARPARIVDHAGEDLAI